MPYIFNWHDSEHTIIRVEMVGQVSWEAFSIITEHVDDELAKAPHRIDLIFDDKVGMPKGNPMPHLKATNARLTAHNNLGLIITISSRTIYGFTKIMVDIMSRAYKIDNTHSGGFVTTMEEALAIIEKSRTKEQVVIGIN